MMDQPPFKDQFEELRNNIDTLANYDPTKPDSHDNHYQVMCILIPLSNPMKAIL